MKPDGVGWIRNGEAVVLCPKTGLSLFEELHSGRRDRDVILYAFDLLELDGADLRGLPLIDRKAMLGKLLAPVVGGIELSEHIEADGVLVFRHACKLGCEGIRVSPQPRMRSQNKAWPAPGSADRAVFGAAFRVATASCGVSWSRR